MDALLQLAQQCAQQSAVNFFPIHNRVAYVVSHGQSYASNGYAIRTQAVAKALNEHGFEVLCFVKPGRPWELNKDITKDIAPEVIVDGVRYIHSRLWEKAHNAQKQFEKSVEKFVELFQVYRPSVVLAASNWIVGLPAWVAAKRLGIPFHNEVRGFWELSRDAREPGYADTEEYQIEKERDTFVSIQAETVFTLNNSMKNELINRGIDGRKIHILPNAVNKLPDIKNVDPRLIEELGIAENEKVIGYIGSFSAYEGLDILVEACSILVDQGQKLKLLLVGDNQPLTVNLSSNHHKSNYSKLPWVVEVGRVPHANVAHYYALIDLIVIPRKKFSVCGLVPPMKIVEALSYRKGIIVSDVAALKEYADRYEHVVTFESENSKSLVMKMQKAFSMPIPQEVDLLMTTYISSLVNKLSVMKQTVSKENTPVLDFTLLESFSKNNNVDKVKGDNKTNILKAISIMDEISEECWKYEFKNFRINRNNYKSQVESSSASFAFLESCWKGNGGSWEYAFTSPGLKHANAQALLDLIPIIRHKGMPIVFWNKEDPMHYERYLPIAKQADIIFTTDSNKVIDYQRDIPSADVHAVPFAAQQKICNPSNRFKIQPESVCFAGSYYSEGHDDRKQQMHALLPSIIDFNGAIYDRFSKLNNDRYKFPEIFHPFIRDAVPFNEIVQLYKRFKVFLNVNTIVDSPTMMSRRVYELLACGTPVVSTPSKAIEEQFSGIVQMASDSKEANQIIEKLLSDDHYWEKISHLGYREVMTKHTYTHRLESIKKSLGFSIHEGKPLVSIITCTRRPNMIDRIVENMTRQNHPNCELILVVQDFTCSEIQDLILKLTRNPSNINRVELISNDSQNVTLGERFNHAATYAKGEYIAKMDDDDFYFQNYLSDMLIPFSFGDFGMVGKKELYMYLSGSNKLIKRFSGMKHRVVDFVAGPTFVIRRSVFNEVKFESRNTGEDSSFIKNIQAAGYKIYASDPFNFIQFRADPSKHTWGVSDEEILQGKQTQIVDNYFNSSRVDF
ncbi:glycosyltransferase [Nitrincola alkalisediminis]|uniref:glycosyltransferase n=1 Tax=Nitrincola alkalisediminis TaxID=1366656 RepID=UPI0018747ADE|nr:glycosyltransferase [Nitrincola alkalisediminis]